MNDPRPSTPINDDMPLDKAVPSNSKYISKEDVDPPILVQIAYLTSDQVENDGKLSDVAVLHFHGDVKPLILKHTNKELLKAITGAQTAGAVKDHQIVLYNDPSIMFGTRVVGGVRIRAAQQAPAAAPVSHVPGVNQAPPAALPGDPGSHEDIPY